MNGLQVRNLFSLDKISRAAGSDHQIFLDWSDLLSI